MSARAAGLYTQARDPVTGLTYNQRQVLNGLTGEPRKTQMEIARELGISRQRVHQITDRLVEMGFRIKRR
jgi:DNA-binding MarR family transcriptional regulator